MTGSTTLTLTMGLPASGKTTWAKTQDALLISTDPMRINQRIDRGAYTASLMKQAHEALRQGTSVVIDACSLNQYTRTMWLSVAAQHRVPPTLALLDCPFDVAMTRNRNRVHPVTISSMHSYRKQMPGAILSAQRERWATRITIDGTKA